jgi:putative hydrolases of HD superfamily
VEDISRFILNRSAAHIKRYHTTPTLAQESVAEHSHFVAMITRIICCALEQAGHQVDTLRAVDLAMIHDYEEAISGDIISTFKHSDPEFVELLDRLTDKAIDQVFEPLPEELSTYYIELWRGHNAGSLEGQIVSVADKLAGLAYAHEQLQMGNHFMEPVYRRFVWLIGSIPYEWWKLVGDRVAGGLVDGPVDRGEEWHTTWPITEAAR